MKKRHLIFVVVPALIATAIQAQETKHLPKCQGLINIDWEKCGASLEIAGAQRAKCLKLSSPAFAGIISRCTLSASKPAKDAGHNPGCPPSDQSDCAGSIESESYNDDGPKAEVKVFVGSTSNRSRGFLTTVVEGSPADEEIRTYCDGTFSKTAAAGATANQADQ